MKYLITHKTTYSGTEPVSICHNESWLRPRDLPFQVCNGFELQITPPPSIRTTRLDSFGNEVSLFSFNQGYQTLSVTAVSQVTVNERTVSAHHTRSWEAVRDEVRVNRQAEAIDAYQFVFESPRIRTCSEFREYAEKSFVPQRDIREAALELTERVFADFEFDSRATTVTTPVEEVFRLKRGVCQDFAHLQIAMLRSLGLPARYVSGYLRTLPPAGQPRLIGADASHAWVSLYCGSENGWLDFDPTNNKPAGTDHITVAWGRDYSDVPPLRGVYMGGGSNTLGVSVDVKPC